MPVPSCLSSDTHKPCEDEGAAQRVYEFAVFHAIKHSTCRGNAQGEFSGKYFHGKIISLPASMGAEGTTEIIVNIGHRLKVLRFAVGARNLAKLCRDLGVSGSSVWDNWESGRNMPDDLVLLRFKRLYPGVSLDYIYDGDKNLLRHDIVQALEQAEADLADDAAIPEKPKRGRPKLKIVPKAD